MSNEGIVQARERRELPLNQPLRETLRGIVRRLDSPYVFVDEGGRRYKDVKKSFSSALKNSTIERCSTCIYEGQKTESQAPGNCPSCGGALRRDCIKNFHFHDLRHTFASHLLMAGVDITTVKELLGNKTLAMTLRYAHLAPTHKIKAVEILKDSMGQNSTIQKTIQFKRKGANPCRLPPFISLYATRP